MAKLAIRMAQRLVAGTFKFDRVDLIPRKVTWLRNRTLSPRIKVECQHDISRALLSMGKNPVEFGLSRDPPPVQIGPFAPKKLPGNVKLKRRRIDPATGVFVGKSAKLMPERLAKIAFVKRQMADMPRIIGEWREKKRKDKDSKRKRYPF